MTRILTVAERVQRGAELLDRRLGPDWRQRVNPRSLRMANACQCVLGQLYGGEDVNLEEEESGYSAGLHALRIRHAEDYGFTILDQDVFSGRDHNAWKELAKAWRVELKRVPVVA